ncbi:hypothetical protein ABB02_01866 [Clostridiaceae bacterium JG1575]|nr:hypothetical protein ABB02_01866 [Clostridiaceae bacterium JG1575]
MTEKDKYGRTPDMGERRFDLTKARGSYHEDSASLQDDLLPEDVLTGTEPQEQPKGAKENLTLDSMRGGVLEGDETDAPIPPEEGDGERAMSSDSLAQASFGDPNDPKGFVHASTDMGERRFDLTKAQGTYSNRADGLADIPNKEDILGQREK